MKLFQKIKRRLTGFMHRKKQIEPAEAYDLWASTYDEQTDNPIVHLNELVFNEMLANINMEGKTVVDVGCGTGQHWEKIFAKKPLELIGYEISDEMLNKLHGKYPHAKTYIAHDNNLTELKNESCDIVVSTLVIGYIENLLKAFVEWNRVLKKGGEILIIDFHPEALQKGANRSFRYEEQIFFIKNYIHSLTKIKALSKKLNWEEVDLIEKKVDNSIKHFYEKHNSLEAYKESFNTPILYGCHFRKVQ